jgi:hypothetical protein
MQRARIAAAAALLVTLLAPAAVARAGTQDPKALRFADGAYQGSLVYTGDLTFGGGGAAASGSGPLSLTVNAGTVAIGSFVFVAAADSVTPDATATATATIEGIIDGPSDKPVLRGSSGTFAGTATSQGFQVPFSFSFGAAELRPASMNIDSASCTLVSGDFVQEYSSELSAAGIPNSLYGRFTAVRTGDAPLPNQPEVIMAELLAQASELAQQALNGALDTARLLTVVEQAESFSTSLAKNSDCGFISDAGAFNTVITSVIQDLLDLVTQDPDAFTTAELAELLSIGLRVGAVGEGAINQAASDKIIGNFKGIFSDRLDAAITAGDEAEIKAILLVAITFGWSDLVAGSEDAL